MQDFKQVGNDTGKTALSEKDLHCMGRVLQSLLYEDSMFFCCSGYCRYSEECGKEFVNSRKIYFDTVRVKVNDALGIYMGKLINPDYLYREMAKNSYFENERINPFDDMKKNCPKMLTDWQNAKGAREWAKRVSMLVKKTVKQTLWGLKWRIPYLVSCIRMSIRIITGG